MASFDEGPGAGYPNPPSASSTSASLDERLKARHSASRQPPALKGTAGRGEVRKQLFSESYQKPDQAPLLPGKSEQFSLAEGFLSRSHVVVVVGLLTLLALSFFAFRQSFDVAADKAVIPSESSSGEAGNKKASANQAGVAKAGTDSNAKVTSPQQQLAAAADCLKGALAKQLKQEGLQESLAAAEASHKAHLQRRKRALKQSPVASWEDAWSRILVPTYSCPREVRIGPWGPGGWWVCRIDRTSRKLLSSGGGNEGALSSKAAAVVSAGGVTDGSFEKQLSATLGKGSVAHIVDKLSTAAGDGIKLLKKELAGSKYQKRMARKAKKLGVDADRTKGMITLEELLPALGPHVSVFKLDCDSCEAGVIEDMQRLSKREDPLFDQVLLTLHRATNVDVIRAAVSGLEALGYRMFHAEPEVKSKAGFRVSFIHESLVDPGDSLESSSISLCQPTGVFGGDKQKWRSVSSCLSQSTQQLQAVSSMKWALRRSQRSYAANLDQRKGGLRALQGRPIKDRRDLESLLLVPQYPCAQEERLGKWGEGGKWVCMTHINSLDAKWSPTAVSIGSTGESTFEADVYKRFGSATDVFDLSLDVAAEKSVSSLEFVRFHKLGVAAKSALAALNKKQPGMWVDVKGLMESIHASFIDMLMIDCEGCEVEVTKDLAKVSKRSSPLFGQILMELHDLEDVGATTGLLLTLEGLGFRMFHAEANGYCHSCYEVAFIHESLVNAKSEKLHLNSGLVLPRVKACLDSSKQ